MRITPILASTFRSDGGAMFGLVPKPIWSKRLAADDRNRIPQNANVLLLRTHDGKTGLVDTGCGHAELFTDREREIHGLSPGWPLKESLTLRGISTDSIDFVILTHLHWDHAGGVVTIDDKGARHPTFPNARHYVHSQEWKAATSKDPLYHKAYPPELVTFIGEQLNDRLSLIGRDLETIEPGVKTIRSGGHTAGHMTVVCESHALEIDHPQRSRMHGAKWAAFAADVCPTQHHMRLVFQTAYDTYPLDTRRWKRAWLPKLAKENGMLFFGHDPDVYGATIAAAGKEEYTVTACLPVEGRP